jgi:hypothetical protein
VELFRGLNDFPGAGKTGGRHKSVACFKSALRAVVAGDHDDTRQEMAELALREDNAPFSGLGFPYAGIEAAVRALKQVGRCLSGIA